MSDNFYEIENNPTTGEDVSRVADVASAQELATMENDMRNREVELKEVYKYGTETERKNLEIAEGLQEKFPHAFEQIVLSDGSKVTLYKKEFISMNRNYILNDPEGFLSSIQHHERGFVAKGIQGSPYQAVIFSKEGYIKTTLNMDTAQFDDEYFKPDLQQLEIIIDRARKILKDTHSKEFCSDLVKIPLDNGKRNILAQLDIFPQSLADYNFSEQGPFASTLKNMSNAFKIAEIIGQKEERDKGRSTEDILDRLT
ncbi:MAG: hypothetical protein RBS01_04020 [Candidatus Dojkabacteria bacterium]|jgi:hypothetical protein|nr:hypothetical protein [Candidatus Dojkabacteria bacterium]